MPTRIFTNKDLPPSVKEYHPPDILDDDMSPPDILDELDDIIDEPQVPLQTVSPDEPGTSAGGIWESIKSGEALNAGLQGGLGFLKGAVLDIPETIIGGAQSAWNLAKDIAPIPGNNPLSAIGDRLAQIPEGIRGIDRIAQSAGSNPEEFGRMMGQMTGQPAVMGVAGPALPGIARAGIRGAGLPVETVGRIMAKHQPLSGFIPRLMEPRIARTLEKSIGKGIENIGRKMRTKTVNGTVVEMFEPEVAEGNIVRIKREPLELPPSRTSFYGQEELPNPIITPDRGTPKQLGPSKTFYMEPTEGAIKNIAESVSKDKVKVRLNRDGTFTDMSTGEVFNAKGKPLPEPKASIIEEIPKKEVTIENAPPNRRAKIMRGMNDPVDVLFADDGSREIFGAGQRLFSANKAPNPALVQRFTDASNRISKDYGLPIEQARKVIGDYNAKIRSLSKEAPKYGEGLNIKAPSFDEFVKSVFK